MPRPFLCLLLSTLTIVPAGCGGPTVFRPDEVALAQAQIVPTHREQIAGAMATLFGSPDEPVVPPELAPVLDDELLSLAAGPVESHTPGVTHGLYRRHCARCHGVTGDGRGPAALYQEPYPRDFRLGVFKWKSTTRGAPPREADLHALLERGVPGAAMPSFRLLQQEERDALVAYVKYLAIRGQAEQFLTDYVAEEFDFDPIKGEALDGSALSLDSPDDRAVVGDWLTAQAERWRAPATITPPQRDASPDTPANIARGKLLFHDTTQANCVKCHGVGGVSGDTLRDLDEWNRRRQDFLAGTELLASTTQDLGNRMLSAMGPTREQLAARLTGEKRLLATRQAAAAELLPPVAARPRTLRGGVLRGGNLFVTIHQGIAGTPMPGVGGALTDEEVEDLAAYVRSLLAHPPASAIANE